MHYWSLTLQKQSIQVHAGKKQTVALGARLLLNAVSILPEMRVVQVGDDQAAGLGAAQAQGPSTGIMSFIESP